MLQVKDRHGLAEMMTGLLSIVAGEWLCASFQRGLIGSGNSVVNCQLSLGISHS